MRSFILLILSAGIAGCAATQAPGDMAPYKAIVVFEWLGQDTEGIESTALPSAPASHLVNYQEEKPAAAGAEPTETDSALPHHDAAARKRVEDEIILGLEDQEVFSAFLVADWQRMHQVALEEKADLLVLLRIGKLAGWKPEGVRIHPGLAALDGLLWFGTAIGGWWVPDKIFPTESDIEVYWKRPEPEKAARGKLPPPAGPADIQTEFRVKESLSSGEYKLSLWERAKLWRYPWAYLLNLLMPAALVPISDEREVSRSLAAAAIEDVRRELGQKLRAQNLRAGGAPFLFRLEEPANGSAVNGSTVKLRYRYRLEPGFEEHEATRLSELRIEVRRAGDGEYRPWRLHRGVGIRTVNALIAKDAVIEDSLDSLGPGLNLVRFAARTELGGREITNTIALLRP